MSDTTQKQLVDRYYTWEKLVLVTALLLIFWRVFGFIDTTTLPLLNAVLHDKNKFPHATSIILLIELIFTWIEWKQSDPIARQAKLARVRTTLTFSIAFISVFLNVPALTRGTALEGFSCLWYIFYFLIGLTIAFFSSVIVLVTLMIHTEKGFQLPLIPVATRCVYKTSWPIVLALLVLSYAVSSYAPFAILQVAPWIIGLPILAISVGDINYYFLSYDERGKRIPFRKKISKLKEAFKTHDYLYYIAAHGRRAAEQIGVIPNATPQEQQKTLREHFSKTSENVMLVSRAIDGIRIEEYPKDRNAENTKSDNSGFRIVLANPKAGGLRVETWPKNENPPKNIRQLILKVSYLEKHAKEFLKAKINNQFDVNKFYSYIIDHSVQDTLTETASAEFPLHDAAFAGRQDLIEQFLTKGKSINEQAPNGWTPLLGAVAQGHSKMVKFMLERGANPDLANLQKITPLMYAARYGNDEIARILLDFGADLDLQDIYGETALAVAVRVGQESLVKLFISKGAKTDTRSTLEKTTPLESAHNHGHGNIARLLRKNKR